MKVMGRIEIEGNGEKKKIQQKMIEHRGEPVGLKPRPRPRPPTPGKNVDKNSQNSTIFETKPN